MCKRLGSLQQKHRYVLFVFATVQFVGLAVLYFTAKHVAEDR